MARRPRASRGSPPRRGESSAAAAATPRPPEGNRLAETSATAEPPPKWMTCAAEAALVVGRLSTPAPPAQRAARHLGALLVLARPLAAGYS